MKYAALVGTVSALILVGCESMPWQQREELPPVELLEEEGEAPGVTPPPVPEGGLALATDQRFDDIPLPVGVNEDPSRTYVYESKELQIGRMVYTTKASVAELAQFYIEECPAADWTLESVLEAEGAHLVFLKPDKRLEVTIREQGVGRPQLLVLNLTPEGVKAPTAAGGKP